MTDHALTCEQSRRVDQIAITRYGIDGLVLMENAGRGCADVLDRLGIVGPVAICCGAGNNGGDGYVIARHLELRGFEVRVLLFADPHRLRGDAERNFQILTRAETPMLHFGQKFDRERLSMVLADCDWIIDALLGTGSKGNPRPPLDEVIRLLNDSRAKRLAVDVPSGLDCDSGQPCTPTFHADHTCTFVARKVGFANPNAVEYLGQLHILDIGAPARIVEEVLRAP